ncbi:hypothetical protein HK100_005501 [Physocladia obscura]|uniref:SH3 domain-containing protein n=1 Tax=Physocladia obscura TaxID=109957 RepID=A0AAD5SRJ2_9FUNG|nr:hypothetical protein HK100_005501 [Physocladia obscura]
MKKPVLLVALLVGGASVVSVAGQGVGGIETGTTAVTGATTTGEVTASESATTAAPTTTTVAATTTTTTTSTDAVTAQATTTTSTSTDSAAAPTTVAAVSTTAPTTTGASLGTLAASSYTAVVVAVASPPASSVSTPALTNAATPTATDVSVTPASGLSQSSQALIGSLAAAFFVLAAAGFLVVRTRYGRRDSKNIHIGRRRRRSARRSLNIVHLHATSVGDTEADAGARANVGANVNAGVLHLDDRPFKHSNSYNKLPPASNNDNENYSTSSSIIPIITINGHDAFADSPNRSVSSEQQYLEQQRQQLALKKQQKLLQKQLRLLDQQTKALNSLPEMIPIVIPPPPLFSPPTSDYSATADPAHHISPPTFHSERVATQAHIPGKPDELEVAVGDLVTVTFAYPDGWAFGLNKNTKMKGAFPLSCLAAASATLLISTPTDDNNPAKNTDKNNGNADKSTDKNKSIENLAMHPFQPISSTSSSSLLSKPTVPPLPLPNPAALPHQNNNLRQSTPSPLQPSPKNKLFANLGVSSSTIVEKRAHSSGNKKKMSAAVGQRLSLIESAKTEQEEEEGEEDDDDERVDDAHLLELYSFFCFEMKSEKTGDDDDQYVRVLEERILTMRKKLDSRALEIAQLKALNEQLISENKALRISLGISASSAGFRNSGDNGVNADIGVLSSTDVGVAVIVSPETVTTEVPSLKSVQTSVQTPVRQSVRPEAILKARSVTMNMPPQQVDVHQLQGYQQQQPQQQQQQQKQRITPVSEDSRIIFSTPPPKYLHGGELNSERCRPWPEILKALTNKDVRQTKTNRYILSRIRNVAKEVISSSRGSGYSPRITSSTYSVPVISIPEAIQGEFIKNLKKRGLIEQYLEFFPQTNPVNKFIFGLEFSTK